VEGHLSNAYDKLEIGSRLELPEALAPADTDHGNTDGDAQA